MIAVWALDDHPVILEGYQYIFECIENADYCRKFSRGEDVMTALESDRPDVLLMDIHLSGQKDGIYWCQHVHKIFPEVAILGVSSFNEHGIVKSFLQAGGMGFVLKIAGPEELAEAVYALAAGKQYIAQDLKEELLEQTLWNKSPDYLVPKLSDREAEVLKLIVAEYSTKEIADKLFLSARTVESHRAHLVEKFGVKNVAGLVREAIKYGIV